MNRKKNPEIGKNYSKLNIFFDIGIYHLDSLHKNGRVTRDPPKEHNLPASLCYCG